MALRVWIAAIAVVLVAAIVCLTSHSPQHMRSRHSEPAAVLPEAKVAITPAGKTFHRPECRYLHGPVQMVDARTAASEGYTPDPRCMPEAMAAR